jgi:hypothetical protein
MHNKGVSIMKRIVVGFVFALLAVPAAAQTYLTSTTNSAAINASQTSFAVASATGIAAGGGLYVNREYMSVRSVSGTTITVVRGQSGTVANAHGASQTVIIVPAAAVPTVITAVDPAPVAGVGTCTPGNHQYLPIINVTNGNVWLCRYTAAAQTSRVWAATNAVLITYNSLLINLS